MKELVRLFSKWRDEPVLVQFRRGVQGNGCKCGKALKRTDPDKSLEWLINTGLQSSDQWTT